MTDHQLAKDFVSAINTVNSVTETLGNLLTIERHAKRGEDNEMSETRRENARAMLARVEQERAAQERARDESYAFIQQALER